MKRMSWALAVGAVLGFCVAYSAVAQAPAARSKAAMPEEAPAPQKALPTDPHEIEVAYAEVLLKLARLDLQKMTDLQNRVRGSITASQFDRVEGLVRVAEDNVRLVKEGKDSRAAMNVVRAREAVRTAEYVWKTAQQVKVAANAISDTELQRLRTMVELERLGLARAEVAAQTDSPLDDLALEIDQMRDDMQRLRYRFEALTARR